METAIKTTTIFQHVRNYGAKSAKNSNKKEQKHAQYPKIQIITKALGKKKV